MLHLLFDSAVEVTGVSWWENCRIMCKLEVDSVKIDSYEESACDFDQSQAEE